MGAFHSTRQNSYLGAYPGYYGICSTLYPVCIGGAVAASGGGAGGGGAAAEEKEEEKKEEKEESEESDDDMGFGLFD